MKIIEPSVLKDHIPPDVTLCNLNPFRSNYQITIQKGNVPSFAEYLEVLENFKQSQEIVYEHFSNKLDMSYFAYACKTEGKNGISRLISALCVNCLNSIPEYSRIIDYSIIWMCIWCGLLQKLYKIKKSELLNSKVYSKV